MRAFRPGPGTMMVHLAMSALPDWKAGEALKRFAYVHLAPDFATMTRAYSDALAGLLPAEPVLVVGQPTAIDPSRAPEGKHVLWVQVRVLPAEIKGDAAGTIAPGDWDAIKERLRRPRDRDSRALCARRLRADSRPRGVLAKRSRARKPQPDRRRQRQRQPPSRPVLPVPPDPRLVALSHAPSKGCISSARRPGRGLGSARGRGFCWGRCWLGKRPRARARPEPEARFLLLKNRHAPCYCVLSKTCMEFLRSVSSQAPPQAASRRRDCDRPAPLIFHKCMWPRCVGVHGKRGPTDWP